LGGVIRHEALEIPTQRKEGRMTTNKEYGKTVTTPFEERERRGRRRSEEK